jgi:uncharacterized protein YndB with AHSA1/START domain
MVTAKKAEAARHMTTFTTPSDREILVTRVVEAPRRIVFEAHTNCRHLPHWLVGPGAWVMHTCELDLRPGGAFRFGWKSVKGPAMEMTIAGMYQEILPPERVVSTESWGEGWPETRNTLVLTEENARTTITMRIQYPSKDDRDRALASGMKDGLSANYDYLDEYLSEIHKEAP